MALKDIVVFVDPSSASVHRLRIAASLARRYAAHLIGVYIVPANLRHHASDGFVRGRDAMRSMAEHHRLARERAALQVGRHFAETVAQGDVQAEFRLVWNDESDRSVISNSLYGDLVVVGQTEPHGLPQNWLPEHLLLASGAPMLVVPNAWTSDTVGERVVIAWNASKEARRAIADALPLLSTAQAVTILIVDAATDPGRHGEEPGANIALHLTRHGARVDVEQLDSGRVQTAEVILKAASRHKADLIVMGAYSHGRSRQLLFGSVTRSIQKDATVPVLMSH